MKGDPKSALHCYNDLMRHRTERRALQLFGEKAPRSLVAGNGRRMGTQEAEISAIYLYNAQGNSANDFSGGDSLTIELECSLMKPLLDMALILGIYSEANVKCFETSIPSVRDAFGYLTNRNTFRCHLSELHLLPGLYYINVGLYPTDWNYVYDYHWQMHRLHIMSKQEALPGISGVVSLRPTWSILT